MNNGYSWNDMLEDFRTLGGVAENVEQRVGGLGYGLFSIKPEKPIAIEIPDSLLIDSTLLILDGDDLVVDPAAGVSPAICNFIERYQRCFSWGADGRESVEAFELSLKNLPEPLLHRLREVALLDLNSRQEGSWDECILSRFLTTRSISYQNRIVSIPVIELINHSNNGQKIFTEDGIQVRGAFENEVTVSYSSFMDPLQRFLNYGFASEELFAYSLPMQLSFENGVTVNIGRHIWELDAADKLGIPKLSVDGKQQILSHLRLGMHDAPRMQRTLLRKRLPGLSPVVVDEIFERVRSYNLATLCGLLELTNEDYTQPVREFRKVVAYQLKALSYCFGVREDLIS